MFRGVRQTGFIPILQSFGANPLDTWGSKKQTGCIRRVTDEQVRALALEIASTNVSTCFVHCPKDPKISLGVMMPYLVMIIKNLKKYFTFEVTILDDKGIHRRIRLSNFEKMNRIHHFCTSMPLCLHPGWNEIYFDLSDITRKAYKTNYMETTRIQIHANCRIRVVYFCDRIYKDEDIPQKLKIFLPTTHICRKKKAEDDEKKEVLAAQASLTIIESHPSEEEDFEEEELHFEESLKSLEESMAEAVLHRQHSSPSEVRIPISPVEEEDEDGDEEGMSDIPEEEEIKQEIKEEAIDEVEHEGEDHEKEALEG